MGTVPVVDIAECKECFISSRARYWKGVKTHIFAASEATLFPKPLVTWIAEDYRVVIWKRLFDLANLISETVG